MDLVIPVQRQNRALVSCIQIAQPAYTKTNAGPSVLRFLTIFQLHKRLQLSSLQAGSVQHYILGNKSRNCCLSIPAERLAGCPRILVPIHAFTICPGHPPPQVRILTFLPRLRWKGLWGRETPILPRPHSIRPVFGVCNPQRDNIEVVVSRGIAPAEDYACFAVGRNEIRCSSKILGAMDNDVGTIIGKTQYMIAICDCYT